MNKENIKINLLIIFIGLLFITSVLVFRDLQMPKEELPKITIINETYESKNIGMYKISNISTIMTKERIDQLKQRQQYLNKDLPIPEELQLKGIDDKTLEEIAARYK